MDVERFLAAQRIARLATVTADGAPHIVPIVYVDGVARVLRGGKEHAAAIALLRAKYPQ